MTAQARQLGGRYEVGELLGYGGMAEVHRGRDLRLGRDVAIKMLRTDLARDATFQERFRREAQNSAALNHPAIVAVYDTGEETSAAGETQPFIVMEFVAGRTLKELLAQEQRLQPRRALEIIADICAALEFSHRHGIIHRDVKPGNVMITPGGQVKVMDFGIARALASGATTMTQTSAVIGTAQYLSPEQARGESVDARSDVYAAGCVLFELLVGHPPFVGDSPVSVAYQHVREDPRAPSDINHDVPPDVDAIVLKALAKNPVNRYQSAQEMRADSLRAVAGRPVLATPVMNEAETLAMQGAAGPYPGQAATAMMNRQGAGGGMRQPERGPTSWLTAVLAALAVLAVVAVIIGYVLSQGPKQNNLVTNGLVPPLTGLTEQQARDALAAKSFTSIIKGADVPTNDCSDPPQVVQQTPSPNATALLTSTITFQLCAPPASVTVPGNLVGSTKSVAEDQLNAQHLVPDWQYVDSIQPKGVVVEVDRQNQQVAPGTHIAVKISRGNQVSMPDVENKDVNLATGILQNDNINFTIQKVDEPGTPGLVINQSVSVGKPVIKNGEPVVLTVISGNVPPTSPSADPSASVSAGGGGGTIGGGKPGGGLLHP